MESVKQGILQLAARRYDLCEQNGADAVRIRAIIKRLTERDELNLPLLREIIDKITVGRTGIKTLVLINGQIIEEGAECHE